MIIDADAHVIETEQTWQYMSEGEQQFRPAVLRQTGPDGRERRFWLVDGRLNRMQERPGLQRDTPDQGDRVALEQGSWLMENVKARVRHMDELGTDIQVLYPTLLIQPVTTRPDVEMALARSYNRWMADIWSEGEHRLLWAAVLPLLTPPEAVKELRWAREHGACAVFMRGIECGNKPLNDPYFYPLYEEARDLDLPVCVHTGNGAPALLDLYYGDPGFSRFKLVGIGAFHAVVFHRVTRKIPGLRFGFIELSAQWLPYVIRDLQRRFERLGTPMPENVLRDDRIYVTCQTNDDLPYIMSYVGGDNLVMGTDYGHADTSTEIYALQTFRKGGLVDPETAERILGENARALYGL